MANDNQSITPRHQDHAQWYQDVIVAADLAENSPVRGCMVIKPYGYAIWEKMVAVLDELIKKQGAANAYFPLFIPMSFIEKEAEHIKGFSPELAVVTHGGGKQLESPLVVRPTSETIIYDSFSRWIKSYRDLPLLINQWANVVRWEMRPRLFLRTTEFLWQEGHTAHASAKEARKYTLQILKKVYFPFAEKYLGVHVLTGEKSESEKFAGALATFCIESLMQDGKSLQMGTSHDLSDHFAKSFGVQYLNEEGKLTYAFNTSWGVSTRLIGGLILSHSDDKGLVLPPALAPHQVVVVPIATDAKDPVMAAAKKLAAGFPKTYGAKFDDRMNLRAGEKFYDWEKKGVPVRIELGPKDLAANSCVLVRRDTGEKNSVALADVKTIVKDMLADIQKTLYDRTAKRVAEQTVVVDTWEQFTAAVEKGYARAFWCERPECEAQIKEKTKATSRLLALDAPIENVVAPVCIACGQKVKRKKRWYFAKAY